MLILVGATTVAIGELDGDPPDAALDLAPVHLGAWAVAVDGEPEGGAPLMALYGSVDDLTWTLAGRAVQLVEWTRTHRFCGALTAGCSPSPASPRR